MLRSGVQGCGPLRPPVSPQPQPSPVSPARASLARPCRRRRAHAHRHRSWRRVRPFRTSRARSKAPQPHLLAPRVRLARPGSAWRLAMRAHRASAARVAAQPPLHPPLEPSERAQRPPAPLYALASPLTLPPPPFGARLRRQRNPPPPTRRRSNRRPTQPSPARPPLVCRRNSLEPQSSTPSEPARHPRAAPACLRARTPPRTDRRAAAASQRAARADRLPVCRPRRRDPLVCRRLRLEPQRPSPPDPAHHPRIAADCAVARRAPPPTAGALPLPRSLTRARAVCSFAAAAGAMRKPSASCARHDAARQPPTGR